MLFRGEGDGLIAISQPAHAWVSGQLARRWGNAQFGGFEPPEEVCLAAALHDIGFVEWEEQPTLNPETGLPFTFLELPTRAHLEIWSAGIRHMLGYGRYPAWLVSAHYTWLCRGHPSDSAADRRLERRFLEEQEELQTTLETSLLNDFYHEARATNQALERNRQFVSLWDWLSLLLCMGLHEERIVDNVPTAEGIGEIRLKPLNAEGTRIGIAPWPFATESLEVLCEGRHLLKRYETEAKMRKALRAASPVTVNMELVPE